MKPNTPNTLFTLKESESIRLGGLELLTIHSFGKPTLKATISAQALNGGSCNIYDSNKDNWQELEYPEGVVIGVGDKLLIGDVQVMMTAFSKKYKTIRLSLRSDNQSTSDLIRKAAGK